MNRVSVEVWKPKDVDELEPTAELVVRSSDNTLVVAGPGAGKTELLAQRACYLLETGACLPPRRILAISFKRDAARNLNDRVRERCGDDSRRFDSLTLDAFAKSLVDRFRQALPVDWRPSQGYSVMTRTPPLHEVRDWLSKAGVPDGHGPVDFRSLSDSTIRAGFEHCMHGYRLPYDDEGVPELRRYMGLRWWRQQIAQPSDRPSLTFPMLNRLAALLLRENSKILASLRATYGFVFLDEFQDTTASQYDLVRTAFCGSDCAVTSVGDSKQRIMVWAGAMTEIFNTYQTDFSATRHALVRNYRSAPNLVAMQSAIAAAIESGAPPAVAAKVDSRPGQCALLEFASPEQEARHIADTIAEGIASEGLVPRDFCVIARQRTSEMIRILQSALTERGVQIRDESRLQDLLSEPAVCLVMAVLRLATVTRAPESWDFLLREFSELFGGLSLTGRRSIEDCASSVVKLARAKLEQAAELEAVPAFIVEQVGRPELCGRYRQYGFGSFLDETLGALGVALRENEKETARATVDALLGEEVVPAMTIHKSKGLEFHTVVFLGLEDSQWWNFSNQPDEEKRSFFVTFSRAIQRVLFTYSDTRDGRYGRSAQDRSEINDLYSILGLAGVPTHDMREA